MSDINNSSNAAGTQPLSVGDDRLSSDNNFTDQSSANPNPSDPVETGETIDQGGYGLSASGGDQFSKENQTGQGFSSEGSGGGQFQPSVQDSSANTSFRADTGAVDTDAVAHREQDM